MPTMDEVFAKVQEALVEALGVDDDEVTEGATLAGDLGAESIDYLDIVFRLEKSFDIKIPRDELLPQDILTSAEYVSEGKLTAAGVEELKKRLPFVNLDQFAENPLVSDFANVLTVGDLCRFVATKVGAEWERIVRYSGASIYSKSLGLLFFYVLNGFMITSGRWLKGTGVLHLQARNAASRSISEFSRIGILQILNVERMCKIKTVGNLRIILWLYQRERLLL